MNFFRSMTLTQKFLFAIIAIMTVAILSALGVMPAHALDMGGMVFGGVALELISGRTTAPGATVTALTPVTGDAFTVRNSNPGKRAWLLEEWAFNNAVGVFELRSPKLHDNVRAIRARVTTADVFPLEPMIFLQQLYPQDVLTPSLSGSAVGGQIEEAGMLIWYEDLPGEAARFIDVATLAKRVQNVFEVEVAITPGATGDYTGAAAINASFDTFVANTDYAIMGYMVDAKCTSVAVRGPDTGNLRVGGPGMTTMRQFTQEWFIRLTERFNLPLIPIFNSANKAGTLVDVQQNQAGGAVNVTLCLAELQ